MCVCVCLIFALQLKYRSGGHICLGSFNIRGLKGGRGKTFGFRIYRQCYLNNGFLNPKIRVQWSGGVKVKVGII